MLEEGYFDTLIRLTHLHSGRPKLYGVLAILSAKELQMKMQDYLTVFQWTVLR